MKLFVGIDLGESGNHTAIAAVERVRLEVPKIRQKFRYVVRFLEEYELGIHYPEQIDRLKETLSHKAFESAAVGADYTGVGRPVIQMMKKQKVHAGLVPILITSGHAATFDKESQGYHVPKRDLVGTLQILLQAELIAWHQKLPAARKLEKQLSSFKVKITRSKNETFGAEGRDQDDIVLAVSLAVWLGENTLAGDVSGISLPKEGAGRSVIDAMPEGVFEL
jgi:hypothetical protein